MIPWLKRIIVYTLENHSFDQLLGQYPGADGLPPDVSLPGPQGQTVSPFPLRWYSPAQLANPNHSWEAVHEEWNHGAMDGFAIADGPDAMGYYPPERVAGFLELARQGRVLDHYFSSLLGPTFPNRLYLISGGSQGLTENPPLFSSDTFDEPTVFDQLSGINIDWRYYIGNFRPGCQFVAKQALFCPLLWFPRFQQEGLKRHLVPLWQFFHDVAHAALPRVSFLAPTLWGSGHPPIPIGASLETCQAVYHALKTAPGWDETILIINFDEAGGFYDHISPPVVDAYGLGIRVPCLILGGRMTPGVVHDVFDHTSVLRMIEEQFQLPLLGERTAMMASLESALL